MVDSKHGTAAQAGQRLGQSDGKGQPVLCTTQGCDVPKFGIADIHHHIVSLQTTTVGFFKYFNF